jgi:hypothetical protein
MQGTVLFAAQALPVLVLMAQDIFMTGAPQYILGSPTGDALGRFTPENDPTILKCFQLKSAIHSYKTSQRFTPQSIQTRIRLTIQLGC